MQNLCKFCICLLILFDHKNNENNICNKVFMSLNVCNYIINVCKILKYLIEWDFKSLLQNFTSFSNIIWIDHEICMYDVIQFYNLLIFCFFLKTDIEILMHSDYVFNDCYYFYSVCENMNRLIIHFVFFIHDVLFFSSN